MDLAQQAEDVGDGGLGDLGDRNALVAELLDDAIRLGRTVLVADVDDLEADAAVAGLVCGAEEQVGYGAGGAVGEDDLAVADEAPAGVGDAVAGGDGAGGEEAAVAEKVGADGFEGLVGGGGGGGRGGCVCAFLLLKRGDEVLKEEVGAGLERDRVVHGCVEGV